MPLSASMTGIQSLGMSALPTFESTPVVGSLTHSLVDWRDIGDDFTNAGSKAFNFITLLIDAFVEDRGGKLPWNDTFVVEGRYNIAWAVLNNRGAVVGAAASLFNGAVIDARSKTVIVTGQPFLNVRDPTLEPQVLSTIDGRDWTSRELQHEFQTIRTVVS